MNDITLATAFYDIGRGRWPSFKRTIEDYMHYFEKISKFQGNMVIYCDQAHKEIISRIRSNNKKTHIITIPFEQLEYHKTFFDRTKSVMMSDAFRRQIIHHHIPEMIFPEYNIINFNKAAFVVDSIQYFNTSLYGWIDFGFGHGKIDISGDMESMLKDMTQGDKLYMGCLRYPIPEMLYHPWSYFSNEVFITGSTFIGTKKSICEFKQLVSDVIDKSLNMNLIDDDQTIYNMAYLIEPNLFKLKLGNWFEQLNQI
jgi:protein YibB